MSIIYDALQKTQAEREQPDSLPTARQKNNFKMNKKLFLWILIISAIGFLTVGGIKYWWQQNQLKKALPPLALSGLFISNQETMAIINNKIVHIGDSIGSMRVVSIKDAGVILQNDQQKILLKESLKIT